MDKIKIRFGRLEDLDQIVSFQEQMALETEGKKLDPKVVYEGVKAVLKDNEKGFYLIATIKEKVAGSLMVTKEWSDWRCGFFWWIQSVYIIPQFRRKRIFSHLYAFVKKRAEKDKNICGLRLYVENNNQKAKKTYQSLGMIKTNYNLYEFDF